ncbi:hypothetical protein TWF730_010617 [Orbilia blumenaviensis]|uniref:Uncharacterized protein n=1 Tax=Orbilia blumenaviensis TaxID=1796055 RepID=A0AAV9UNS6_9PEZI
MSVAYPGQNNPGPSSDSFSASAAFSFDQHNATQVFGAMNGDPQSQMQNQMSGQIPTQSLSVPMIQVNHTGFASDYDMGNAPRDEDIDIDLDLDTYDEDDDMNLDDLSATPAVVDDIMDEAANIPAPNSIYGQPALSVPSGRFHHMDQANDEEMVDDALSQAVNEVMTDAEPPEVPAQFGFQSLQPIAPLHQFQGQQQQQQPAAQHIEQPAQEPQSQASQPTQQLSQIVEQPSQELQSQASQPTQLLPATESGVSNAEASVSPEKSAAAQEVPTVAEPSANPPSAPLEAEPLQSQPPPSEVQNVEESHSDERTLETEKVPLTEESTEPATPPPHSSTDGDELKTPQAPDHSTPKLQTPQSVVDPLRISQAETVALENPTPDVNQRDWYISDGQAASGSPHAPQYPAHQEIPTSPLHGPSGSGSPPQSFPSDPEAQHPHTPHSEQDTEREALSQPSDTITAQSPHDQTHGEAHEPVPEDDHTDNAHADPLLTHPVVVVYRDLEFSLFPISSESSNLPETCFLPDRAHLGTPLNKLVAALRDVLGEEFTASEELVLNFTALGVEFEEENQQMNNFTLYDLLGLFSKLLAQDGIDEPRPLEISLTSRKKYIPKLEMIHSHIVGGGGLASWRNMVAATRNPTDGHNDNPPHQYSDHEDEDKKPHSGGHAPGPSEKAGATNEVQAEHNDDELELEEFEKGLSGDDGYYDTDIHQTDAREETTAVATIDVPQSPSQVTPEKRKASFARETSNTDVSQVPETQLSQQIEATPNKKLRLNIVDMVHDDNDEASFVTAREKEQDTSVAYSGPRSYGFPDSPGSHEEPEFEAQRPGKDDGLLNFDEDNTHEGGNVQLFEEEDEKSSSTLQEVADGDIGGPVALQGPDGQAGGANNTNWQEWTYTEDDGAEHGVAYGLPGDLDESADAAAAAFELGPNEFAEFPLPFSDAGDGEPEYDDDDDAPLLGLDHHDTLSTTTSTKRARDDDEEEIEDELSEAGELRDSPTPASKKHRTL